MAGIIKQNKFFLIALLILNINLCARDSTLTATFWIVHYKTIKSSSDLERKGLIEKIGDFILGTKDFNFSKPISLLAKDTNTIIVLDQGIEKLAIVNRNNNSINYVHSKLNFPSLVSVCRINNDNYLITDSKNNMIYQFNLNYNTIDPLIYSHDLQRPTGIGYIPSKNEIWVSETGTHSIIVCDINGKIKKRIGERGTGINEFNYPTNIWVDKSEKIYIVDALNFRIQIFNNDGEFISSFGKQGDATGYLARPKGLATDAYGNIYVVDALFHTIQIFNKNGEYLYNFGNQGLEDGNFWLPNGIYIDDRNYIYVADSYNSRIQIFKLMRN